MDRDEPGLGGRQDVVVDPVAHIGDLAGATDCSSLVEARGGRVKAVEGDPHLLKITTQADLELVESWL